VRDDREPHERWFTRGTGIGLLVGLLIGFWLGDVIVGLMIGVIMGAGLGVLANPNTRRDRDREERRRSGEDGALDRGVLWLLVGLGVGVLVVLATAPELMAADLGELGEHLLIVLLAGVPGAAIVGVLAYRRRGRTDDEER
jgi:hypothetical protein